MKEDSLFRDISISNLISIWINTKHYTRGCLQVNWQDVIGDGGYYQMEGSNDSSHWSPLGISAYFTEGDGTDLLPIAEVYCKYVRAVVAKGSIASGKFSAILVMKP